MFDDLLIVFSGGEVRALVQTLAGEKMRNLMRKLRKKRRKMPSKREEGHVEEKKEEAADTVDYANEKVPAD